MPLSNGEYTWNVNAINAVWALKGSPARNVIQNWLKTPLQRLKIRKFKLLNARRVVG